MRRLHVLDFGSRGERVERQVPQVVGIPHGDVDQKIVAMVEERPARSA